MERYGYLVTGTEGLKYINTLLYTRFIDCVQAVLAEDRNSGDEIHYFKILKTSDVVKLIHSKQKDKKYGYCYLLRSHDEDKFTVHNSEKEPESDLLNVVLAARHGLKHRDVVGCADLKIKLGYYKIMSDEDFLSELHNCL